jgi:16S rRNA (adenine(1408)-N(1))-methyltransferase
MREFSGRAARERIANLLYVRSAVEDLPPALDGVADRLTVVLPWGSLLAAVARPSVGVLRGIRGLCQPHAVLTIVLGSDPVRDHAEWLRLGLRPLPDASLASRLAAGYALAGFTLGSVRPMAQDELALWPSTWARRLAHGRRRTLLQITMTATDRSLGRHARPEDGLTK